MLLLLLGVAALLVVTAPVAIAAVVCWRFFFRLREAWRIEREAALRV